MDPFAPWTFYVIPWAAAVVAGALLAATGRRWWQAVGLALMSVPVWDTLWGIASSFQPLLEGGFVLQAYTTRQLSYVYSYKALSDLGYVGSGLLLHQSGGTWRGLFLSPRAIAQRLVALGVPTGHRSEGGSAFLGIVVLPLFLFGAIGIDLATRGLEALRQSDESSVFSNMTLYHAILLSAAAAFGEEFVYRGVLQTGLSRRMPMAAAVVVQAIVFGFAHSGYGTWIHVLLPTLFGLLVGVAAWRFGLPMAVMLHFLVDLYAFGFEASNNQPWLVPVLNTLLLANLLATLGWAAWWLTGKIRRQGQAV